MVTQILFGVILAQTVWKSLPESFVS